MAHPYFAVGGLLVSSSVVTEKLENGERRMSRRHPIFAGFIRVFRRRMDQSTVSGGSE